MKLWSNIDARTLMHRKLVERTLGAPGSQILNGLWCRLITKSPFDLAIDDVAYMYICGLACLSGRTMVPSLYQCVLCGLYLGSYVIGE